MDYEDIEEILKKALEDGILKDVALKHGAKNAREAVKILRKEYGITARREYLGACLFINTPYSNFRDYAVNIMDESRIKKIS